MSYQALYRKYRPKNFDEVSGQNVTVRILKNAIKNNKIAHAYLFFGPRGTGKTSIAKIFARAINCKNSHDGIQCENCDSCIISKEKECVDIIEIDAASNNGVNEIRELKNKVSFVPSELKYKVYIIDEVHMLSIAAFNALLKTLEEPPEHIVFILATTELNKVPSTIISRCQTLEFNKINLNDMKNRLKNISEKEKIQISDEAIEEIAKYSNGGLRDAIGTLEKAISYTDKKIEANDIKEISGNITSKELNEFLSLIEDKNIEGILKKIEEYYNNGTDLIKLLNEIIECFRNDLIENRKDVLNKCSMIRNLNSLEEEMRKSDNPKIIFEIAMLNMIYTNDSKEPQNIETKENYTSNKITENKLLEETKEGEKRQKEIRVNNTLCNPKKENVIKLRNSWDNLKDLAFDMNYGNIARLLSSDILPVAASDTNVILISKLNGLAEQINSDLYTVEKIFQKAFGYDIKPICISEKEWNEYIEKYKKNKSSFKYIEEIERKKNLTLKERAKELFEEI
ncbi:DNA polymerase III subunit gamma/tau [uncultured Clostridium sp.]|uniref:DNA polymerase III subunit gamma/tau n=1 Tax=uncultured Clostridium sp. TaxID=59620 RepID=UPI0025CF02CC|nr:DNA polymerase III subunit gamma/tau [uncultured Clostridium sp.]